MTNEKDSGELELDEINFILNSCLKAAHRNDPKIIQFIDSFVKCKSIPQASEEVGIAPGIGFQWRHRKDISNCISKLYDKSTIKYGFDASELVERVKEMSEVDPIEFENPDGTYKTSLSQIAPEVRRAIKKFKVKNLYASSEDSNGMKSQIIVGQLIEVELYDKLKATELLGREKDLFKQTTKIQHDVTENMAATLLASSRLADKVAAPIEPVETDYIEVEKEFPKMESE